MKIDHADFVFDAGTVRVRFDFLTDECTVTIAGKQTQFENRDRRYKACVTHAAELIRRSLPEPEKPKTNWEGQRRQATKVALKVFE